MPPSSRRETRLFMFRWTRGSSARSLLRHAWIVLAVATAQMAAAAPPPQRNEILIGLIPEMNIFQQMERFTPLAAHLGNAVSRPVRLSILTRYGNIVENFEHEHLDGAFFGSFTGALAIERLGVRPLARPVNLDGKSTYSGFIFARKDGPIRGVSDMRGQRFAFVEKSTSAGYVFPLAYLRAHGVARVDKFLGGYFFAGSHDASVYAVLEGSATVGAAKNTVYDWVRGREPRVDRELVILARSGEFPSNGLAVRKDFNNELARKLKAALLSLHQSPEGLKVLAAFRGQRFIETRVEDYRPVFELAGKAGIDLKTYSFRND